MLRILYHSTAITLRFLFWYLFNFYSYIIDSLILIVIDLFIDSKSSLITASTHVKKFNSY